MAADKRLSKSIVANLGQYFVVGIEIESTVNVKIHASRDVSANDASLNAPIAFQELREIFSNQPEIVELVPQSVAPSFEDRPHTPGHCAPPPQIFCRSGLMDGLRDHERLWNSGRSPCAVQGARRIHVCYGRLLLCRSICAIEQYLVPCQMSVVQLESGYLEADIRRKTICGTGSEKRDVADPPRGLCNARHFIVEPCALGHAVVIRDIGIVILDGGSKQSRQRRVVLNHRPEKESC